MILVLLSALIMIPVMVMAFIAEARHV